MSCATDQSDTTAEAQARALKRAALGKTLLHWKLPFRYIPDGQVIVDAADNRIADVRGWGFLTGKGSEALGMKGENAERIQDQVGEAIADFLNHPL